MSDAYRLDISDKARSDLASARLWLLQPGSGRLAHGRYQAILEAIQDLKTSPFRWPVGDIAEVRERPVKGHRVLYRVDAEARRVRIMRVFGPYQDRASL